MSTGEGASPDALGDEERGRWSKLVSRVRPEQGASRGLTAAGMVVALAAAFLTLFAWAWASPPGSSPDDDFHMASIWCRSDEAPENCRILSRLDSSGLAFAQIPSFPSPNCYIWKDKQSGACQTPWVSTERLSTTAYPPLFYNYVSIFAADSLLKSNVTMRMAVACSVLFILSLAYLVSLPWLRGAMVVSWVLMSMPLGVFLFASVNPSAWGVAGMAAMWGPMVTAFLSESARQRWIALAVWFLATLMAAGSRGDTAIFAAVISVLGLALLARRRSQWPAIAMGVIVVGVSAWMLAGTAQLTAAGRGFGDKRGSVPDDELIWSLVTELPKLAASVHGGLLGWLDAQVSLTAASSIMLAVGGAYVAGLAFMNRRKALALVALVVATFAVPVRAIWQSHRFAPDHYQPRYLLPMLVVVLGVCLLAGPGRRIMWSAWQIALVWGLLSLGGLVALNNWMRRFTTGNDVQSWDLSRKAEWWANPDISPDQMWVLGSVSWSVLVLVVLMSFYRGRAATGPVGSAAALDSIEPDRAPGPVPEDDEPTPGDAEPSPEGPEAEPENETTPEEDEAQTLSDGAARA